MKINNPTHIDNDLRMLHLACTTGLTISDISFAERLANVINASANSKNNSVICNGTMLVLSRKQQLFGSVLNAEIQRVY